MSFKFALLSPRLQDAAINDKAFADAPAGVLGVEVTVPGLAARCTLGNLDPQHTGGDASRAAIEDALTVALPPDGACLATVRPDPDAVGSMAILAMRVEGMALSAETLARVERVAAADKSERGPWAPKAIPTADAPWAPEAREYAALAAAVGDFKVPMADRVSTMEKWLLTGEEPAQYRVSVERERADMIAALASGAIRHETRADGRIAVVESTHRAATSVGYSLAPVVVARNPSFKAGPNEPVVKYTICQFAAGFADIKGALAQLAALEAGWGGSPTIGGSPQGVSSQLALEQVVEVVTRHLKTCHCTDGPRPCVPAGEKSPVCAWCHASLA